MDAVEDDTVSLKSEPETKGITQNCTLRVRTKYKIVLNLLLSKLESLFLLFV